LTLRQIDDILKIAKDNMNLFKRKKEKSFDWKKDIEAYKASIVRFLRERGAVKLTPDMYILERKIVFLLDDLREAIANNQPELAAAIAEEIGPLWLKLWDLRRGAKRHD
jgi:hypothetical protein